MKALKTPTNFTVVIAVDTHPGRDWDFPLTQHWLCKASLHSHYVFVIPDGESLPIGMAPIVTMSKRTAFYFWTEWLNRRFTFLTNHSDTRPEVGYIIRTTNLFYRHLPTVYHAPIEAIKITAHHDSNTCAHPSLRFEAGIVDLMAIPSFQARLTRSENWIAKIWESVPSFAPAPGPYDNQLVRLSDPYHPFDTHFAFGKQTASLELKYAAAAFLYPYWHENGTKVEACARELHELGIDISVFPGTLHNLLATAGITAPSSRQLAKLCSRIAKSASAFYSANPECSQEADQISEDYFGWNPIAFLSIVHPEAFNESLATYSLRSGGTDDGRLISGDA